MEQTFITTIRNERKVGVVLYSRLGDAMEILGPGKSRTLEAATSETLYSQFSEIVYKADGSVVLTENPNFPKPSGKWLLVCTNVDGDKEASHRIIGGKEVVLLRNIPRTFELTVDDPLAIYSKMEIKKVTERFASTAFVGYSEFQTVGKDVYTDRPDNELDEIRIELEKLIAKE